MTNRNTGARKGASATRPAAINMTGDQLRTELERINALVSGGLNLIAGIADDAVLHAEVLLGMAADNLLDLTHHCTTDQEGGAA